MGAALQVQIPPDRILPIVAGLESEVLRKSSFLTVGFDRGHKRALLVPVIAVTPATHAVFLALGRQLIVCAHPTLDYGCRFQFLRCVIPPAFDLCAFIKIKLLGVEGPEQVLSGGPAEPSLKRESQAEAARTVLAKHIIDCLKSSNLEYACPSS
jgi:hypothetical protein